MKKRNKIKLLEIISYLPLIIFIGLLSVIFGKWFLFFIIVLGGYIKWVDYLFKHSDAYKEKHPFKYKLQVEITMLPILMIITAILSWVMGYVGIFLFLFLFFGLLVGLGLFIGYIFLLDMLEQLKSEIGSNIE